MHSIEWLHDEYRRFDLGMTSSDGVNSLFFKSKPSLFSIVFLNFLKGLLSFRASLCGETSSMPFAWAGNKQKEFYVVSIHASSDIHSRGKLERALDLENLTAIVASQTSLKLFSELVRFLTALPISALYTSSLNHSWNENVDEEKNIRYSRTRGMDDEFWS